MIWWRSLFWVTVTARQTRKQFDQEKTVWQMDIECRRRLVEAGVVRNKCVVVCMLHSGSAMVVWSSCTSEYTSEPRQPKRCAGKLQCHTGESALRGAGQGMVWGDDRTSAVVLWDYQTSDHTGGWGSLENHCQLWSGLKLQPHYRGHASHAMMVACDQGTGRHL